MMYLTSLLVAQTTWCHMVEWLVDKALAQCILAGAEEDNGYKSIH